MKLQRIVNEFWDHIDKRSWDELSPYFIENAEIFWPNTNEAFTVNQFIEINRNYPGVWSATIINIFELEDTVISIVKITDDKLSFHVASAFYFQKDKIRLLQEYWSQDDLPPKWRGTKYLKNK